MFKDKLFSNVCSTVKKKAPLQFLCILMVWDCCTTADSDFDWQPQKQALNLRQFKVQTRFMFSVIPAFFCDLKQNTNPPAECIPTVVGKKSDVSEWWAAFTHEGVFFSINTYIFNYQNFQLRPHYLHVYIYIYLYMYICVICCCFLSGVIWE